MVEYKSQLDLVFDALADPTRRDILHRLSASELSVNQISATYELTVAAVSKHVRILEQAQLVQKRKAGKYRFVSLVPGALIDAVDYLESC